MVETRDECVECGKLCIDSCPYKSIRHLRCDKCGNEVDTLYVFEGEELCADCVLDYLEKVEL